MQSQETLNKFENEALHYLAGVISGSMSTAALYEFFERSGEPIPSGLEAGSKQRLVYAHLHDINEDNRGQFRVVSLVAKFCAPTRFIGRDQERLGLTHEINKALIFNGIQIDAHGRPGFGHDKPLNVAPEPTDDILSALTDVKKQTPRPKAKIFISHSGETPAFYRLDRFLRDLGVEPVVAEWLPFKGRTVPDHVKGAMEGCVVAVVFATKADQVGGRSQPGRGALIETGILQARFEERVVYLVEEGAEFGPMADNFARESFTQDCLERAFHRIVVELKSHGLI